MMNPKQSKMRRITKARQIALIGEELQYLPESILKDKPGNVKKLDLSHNQLQWLHGLENFIQLEELVADNNEIFDKTEFPSIPTLKTLSLNNNKLVNLKSIVSKIVKAYPSLTYLSLLGNKACPMEFSDPDSKPVDYQRYRCYVASFLPQLKFLDWKAVSGSERCKGDELFNHFQSGLESRPKSSSYTPLPKTQESSFDKSGGNVLAGTIKYKYLGRKSEGNRFIRNNDL